MSSLFFMSKRSMTSNHHLYTVQASIPFQCCQLEAPFRTATSRLRSGEGSGHDCFKSQAGSSRHVSLINMARAASSPSRISTTSITSANVFCFFCHRSASAFICKISNSRPSDYYLQCYCQHCSAQRFHHHTITNRPQCYTRRFLQLHHTTHCLLPRQRNSQSMDINIVV